MQEGRKEGREGEEGEERKKKRRRKEGKQAAGLKRTRKKNSVL